MGGDNPEKSRYIDTEGEEFRQTHQKDSATERMYIAFRIPLLNSVRQKVRR